MPTASLIITTYNRADALELVLVSVLKQKQMPDEVIIADDGSTDETRRLVEKYKKQFSVPLIHCWQEDNGFQLSKIRNKAIAQSSGDYIIMADGDMVLSKNFIHDHIAHAQPNQFIQGSRVLVLENATKKHIKDIDASFSFFSAGIKNRANTIGCNWLSKVISKRYGNKNHQKVRGCNMSFWKSDLLKVNGFDENFVGWGREDSEFVVRMINNGIVRKNVKFAAAAFHLWHNENKRNDLAQNDAILETAIQEGKKICEKGLSQYI